MTADKDTIKGSKLCANCKELNHAEGSAYCGPCIVSDSTDDEPANIDQWRAAVGAAQRLGVTEPTADECGYIWLNPDEREGAAECGCWMMGALGSDGPRVFLCELHSAARDLGEMLGHALDVIDGLVASPEFDDREWTPDGKLREARALFDRLCHKKGGAA